MRVGRKKIPCYRVVVMDSRKRRDGAYLEQLGVYHPNEKPARVEIKDDRTLYWLSVGALPTDTVRSLLSAQGIMTRFDLTKRGAKSEQVEAAVSKVKESAKNREARRAAAVGVKKKAASTEAAAEASPPAEPATA